MTLTLPGLYVLITFIVGVPYASLGEWCLHRYIMHRPLKIFGFAFTYPHITHAGEHHKKFGSDDTYLLTNQDPSKIPMAWWNGPAICAVVSLPAIPFWSIWGLWQVPLTLFLTCMAYYGAYERLHWCMHWPKRRLLEKIPGFRKLNGHHLLHHRYMDTNFNVVLPLWDLLLGTLLRRARFKFNQPRGPSIPDVQPIQHSDQRGRDLLAQ